jgi:2'-5' RNA ligase
MALRCFIAVTLPEPLKQSLAGVSNSLKETGADVKWVRERNLHITLKFLGATGEERVEEIISSLRKKLSPSPSFYIRIGEVGSFPAGRHPRVIWIGIQDYGSLKEIYHAVEAVMTQFGYPPEDRPFSPHLTIGRIRSPRKVIELTRRMEEFRTTDFGEFKVEGVALMKSELKPGGAEYESLAEIPLEGG